MTLVRRETAADVPAIDAVHRAAFPEPVEAGLVHELRADAGWVPALSLVAEDGDGSVVGHVVGTVGSLADRPAVGLGPLGVLPDLQRAGVGSALVHAVLAAADALGYPAVALLGSPGYYPRFGFVPAAGLGVEAPDPAWGDHFQVRTLAAWSPDQAGPFRYAAPFDRL